MKTIVEKSTKLSKYIFEDSAEVILLRDKILAPGMVICDLNSSNSELVENVTIPENWEGNKYKFDSGVWYPDNHLDGLSLDQAKAKLLSDLATLREEIAIKIMQIRLINDPEPEQLTQMTPMIRGLYAFGKEEIAALCEENIDQYILRGPQVNGILSVLDAML